MQGKIKKQITIATERKEGEMQVKKGGDIEGEKAFLK